MEEPPKEIKIVIAGSRDFIDYEYMKVVMDEILAKLKEKGYNQFTILSGKARGADSLGEKYARDNDITLEEYPADWKNLGKRAGYVRNEDMARNGRLIVVFWDGESRGSKHMIDLGHKYKRTVLVYKT